MAGIARIGFQLFCAVMTAVVLLVPFEWLRAALEAACFGPLLELVFREDSSRGGWLPVDKVAHFGWFAWLTLVAVWSAPRGIDVVPKRAVLVLVYSWVLEMLQGVIGVRATSFADALSNAAGVLVAASLIVWLDRSAWRFLLGPRFGAVAR